jgi:hypothetical protein
MAEDPDPLQQPSCAASSGGTVGPLIPPDWDGEPLIVVFFFALEQPMDLPEGTRFFAAPEDEPVPWVRWNGGHNFVRFHNWRPE